MNSTGYWVFVKRSMGNISKLLLKGIIGISGILIAAVLSFIVVDTAIGMTASVLSIPQGSEDTKFIAMITVGCVLFFGLKLAEVVSEAWKSTSNQPN